MPMIVIEGQPTLLEKAIVSLILLTGLSIIVIVLACIGWGSGAVLATAAQGWDWLVGHPAKRWEDMRWLSRIGVYLSPFEVFLVVRFFFAKIATAQRTIHTTANFRDQSPYGDANLANRNNIQRAMMGHNTPDAPLFEE